MTIFKSKRPKFLSLCLAGLFLFCLSMTVFNLSGCGDSKKDELNLGYKVYIPNLSEQTITVLPKEKSDESYIIDLDHTPLFIQKLPGSKKIYVLQESTNEIALIDTDSDTVEDTFTFEVGSSSSQINYRLKFLPDGSKGFITTSYSPAGVACIDPSDNSFAGGCNVYSTTIDNMFFNTTGNRLYAMDSTNQKIHNINTQTMVSVDTIKVPEEFSVSLFNADKNIFYMAESGTDGAVKIYDLEADEFTDRIEAVTSNIVKFLLSEDGSLLYVLGSNQIVTIKLSDFTIDDTIDLDYKEPSDLRFLSDSGYFLAPSKASSMVMVLKGDLSTEDSLATGSGPGEMVVTK
ncbi:MAG: WD40 repeat domain-containing protein [Firmicutes bacterium]|nr:WD40 repeat domain-containing protein [Bacillota bacterium]